MAGPRVGGRFWPEDDAEKRKVIGELDRSGLSLASFSETTGIPAGTLSYWRRRFRSQSGQPGGHGADGSPFIPVRVRARAGSGMGSGSAIEVRLARGRALVVEPGFDAEHLARVVAVLESSC
jgi:transposase-like protein